MDFGNEQDTIENNSANSSSTGDEDVEVKHTIYVSTKLKNNNRRGIHGSNDGDGILTYNIGQDRPSRRQDSGEVPVMNGYMAVDTTQIRTPDSRYKHKNIYPDAVFVNRNIRDETDIYPNVATNPAQWKPSNFFKNINLWSDTNRDNYNLARRNDGPLFQPNKLNRKVTNDGMKQFYCRRCRELSQGQGVGCVQQRSYTNTAWDLPSISTSTPKIKIDGKIAKLN